ncbi:MAG: methyltransferase domain-containing protein [Bradyrhizobium sp.]|nr:methyltransferase domain-containing protein [Bradyrhizobium sp.]
MTELIHVRQTCRLCESPRLVRSLKLAEVPIVSPNVATEEDTLGQRLTRIVAPIDNYLCQDCGLNQLLHVVDPSLIYRDYLYRTSVSLGLPEHFDALAKAVIARAQLRDGELVCEFGSNDGTLLGAFKAGRMSVQGVDPAKQIAAEASSRGIPTLPEFFTEALAERIRADRGAARAVVANNAMANIDDLTGILAGVRALLAPDGVFVFETQYALDVFEKTLLDVIYHEHISTFSVWPVVEAFSRHGLTVFDAERIATKGGSIRFWCQLAGGPNPVTPQVAELISLEKRTGLYDLAYHQRFGDKVARITAELHERIAAVRSCGGRVGAYGTSVGCAALIHQFRLEDKLDVLFDDTPFKDRLEGPGYSLPVMRSDHIYQLKPDMIILLAWRYASVIIHKHIEYSETGGVFVIPLPDVVTS